MNEWREYCKKGIVSIVVPEATLEAIRNLGFRCFRAGANAERHCPWKTQTPERTAFMQGWDMAEKSNEPEEYVEHDNEF